MKKLTLFVCALALSVAAVAAVPQAKAHLRSEDFTFKVGQAQFESTVSPRKQKLVDKDTVLVPYSLINSEYRNITKYQVGNPSAGLRYTFDQLGWVTAYQNSAIFINDSIRPATWYIDNKVVAENKAFYQTNLQFGDGNPLPLMKTPGNADTLFLDYQVGGLTLKSWIAEGYTNGYSAINVAPAQFYPITNCAQYTEDPREDDGGNNSWMIAGDGTYARYAYGTQTINPWNPSTKFDTIIVPFNNDGHMVISDITVAIYNDLQGTSADLFPGENDHVRVTLYPTNNAAETWYDYVDWANPIATAVANIDNFTPYTDSYTWLGLLEFDFLKEDPATGALTPGTIEVDGNFIVALSEFNDGTANFGFYADAKVNGQTKFIGYDAEGHYATGLWRETSNILLNIDAYFPAFESPVEVAFAKGETEKAFDVPSNIWDEDIEIDAPEWIEVEVVTDYEVEGEGEDEEWHHLYNDKLTIKVEDSNEARDGEVVLTAYGLTKKILVKQNGGTQGINNIKAVNDNKLYNVLGQEVNEDYKGVVIRNGEKFVR